MSLPLLFFLGKDLTIKAEDSSQKPQAARDSTDRSSPLRGKGFNMPEEGI